MPKLPPFPGTTGRRDWALIGGAAALKSLKVTGNALFARAVIEGYRRGRAAAWLPGEDYEALLAEPLAAARERLGLEEPTAYRKAQRELGDLASYMSAPKTASPDKLAA